jgi:hypothetical protein
MTSINLLSVFPSIAVSITASASYAAALAHLSEE